MPKHILCADDSITMQKVVAITFAHTDYQVATARSADEAIALARQSRPDLVLADAVMPGKTGYDLCQSLKNDPKLRSVPVIIVCGNSAAYDEARGRQVGADASLTKPWDTQVFVEKIGEILARIASQGVAHPQSAGPARPSAPPAPAPAPMAPVATSRPTAPTGIPSQRPPSVGGPPPALAPRPAMVQPRPAAAPLAPTPASGLPKPPAGLPRPPLIRGAPAVGGARPAGAPSPAAPLPRPAPTPIAPAMARPAVGPPPAAPPVARRQATIMGMPAVNMPPAGAPAPVAPPHSITPPPPAPAPVPVAPPIIHTPPPVAARPLPGPPPAAPARPLPGSDALAKAAQRVAAATASAAGVDARGPEYEAIARLSREIIEQIAWEVVPELAEIIIRERLHELKK